MSHFRSHDEMAGAIADARLATYILARADRDWELRACRLGDVLLQHGVEGAPHVTTGRMLPDRIGVLVPGSGSAPRSCNGNELDAGSLYLWGAGSDIAVQARRPGEWWLLSVSAEALTRAAAALGEGGPGPAPASTGPVRARPESLTELRRLLAGAESAIDRAGASGLPAEAAGRLGETLLRAAVRLSHWESGTSRPSCGTRVDRGRIVSRVEEVFAEAGSRPVYVPALCEALGVPERTLRHVFAEQYGAGPTHVLRCRRLCQVYRALLQAPSGSRVAGIARRFGFWHLGQFASDYRALLGELPSETLGRAAAREEVASGSSGRQFEAPAPAAEAVAV